MSTKLFNFTNQRLNADKLRELQLFNSCGFCGIISKDASSPFTISGTTVTLNASENSPVTFIGGGLLLNQDSNQSCSLAIENTLWYIKIILDSSVANITTNELIDTTVDPQINKITFESSVCESINIDANYTYFTPVFEAHGDPSLNQYYEYSDDEYTLSQDSEVDSSKTYYIKIESSRLLFNNSSLSTSTFSYFGNTIWISNDTFIIPLFVNSGGNLVETTIIRDLSDFEGLLSMSAYGELHTYADGTFVWSTGGREPIIAPDGTTHRKGDIGKLNITDDTIYNITHADDSNPNYDTPVKIQNLTINNLANINNDSYTKLIVDANGNISTSLEYVEPIWHGGTGATTRGLAKRNLGIFYGTISPKEQAPVTSPQEGDLYLWIVE